MIPARATAAVLVYAEACRELVEIDNRRAILGPKFTGEEIERARQRVSDARTAVAAMLEGVDDELSMGVLAIAAMSAAGKVPQ